MLILLILFLFLPINLASPTSKQTEGHAEEKLEALEDISPTLVEWLAAAVVAMRNLYTHYSIARECNIIMTVSKREGTAYKGHRF